MEKWIKSYLQPLMIKRYQQEVFKDLLRKRQDSGERDKKDGAMDTNVGERFETLIERKVGRARSPKKTCTNQTSWPHPPCLFVYVKSMRTLALSDRLLIVVS